MEATAKAEQKRQHCTLLSDFSAVAADVWTDMNSPFGYQLVSFLNQNNTKHEFGLTIRLTDALAHAHELRANSADAEAL
jgi:hypothetical protein